jgi:hypothetical protein
MQEASNSMGLEGLTKDEREIALRCIHAVVEGPFICDGDFPLIIGLERSEAAAVASRWSAVNESEAEVRRAIQGSMNALLTWFGWQDENPNSASAILQQWTGATPEGIERLLEKWLGSHKGIV